LEASPASVGIEDSFSGNFTKARFLRGQSSSELERRIGYGPGRLAAGWWLLFLLERPTADNFEFGGYTHFSGSRIGPPKLGNQRPHVEADLATLLGQAGLAATKARQIAALQLQGPERLAKVLPIAPGNDYPTGSGIYQCNIPRPLRCKVAAFMGPGQIYQGNYV
jgi:hypothetical protein